MSELARRHRALSRAGAASLAWLALGAAASHAADAGVPPSRAAVPAAASSPATAHPGARFDIETRDGRIERIVVQRAGSDARLVFDGFSADEDALRDEARRVAARQAKPAFCASAALDDAQCRQTCGWAEAARPFTRVTLQSSDGSSRVLSGAKPTPLRFNAGAGSHTSKQGDCLSPDGRYLSVYAVVGSGTDSARPAIVELADGLHDARFVGERTGKVYGEDRYFDFVGWVAAQPHVLEFSYGRADEPVEDEARVEQSGDAVGNGRR